MVLARLGGPGADAVLGAPDLDHPRQFRMEGDPPIPAIAAHIHEPAAAIDPGLHGVPHGRRVIFRMGPRDDHPVVPKELEALFVQILIGDDVVVDAAMIEPIEEMGIGVVLVEPRAMAAEPGMIARRHVQIRAQAARIADPRAVDMAVVERGTDFRMVVHPEIGMAEGQQPPHLPLGEPGGDMLGMIGIGHVGAGRRQQEHRRAVLSPGGRPAAAGRRRRDSPRASPSHRSCRRRHAAHRAPLRRSSGIVSATDVSQAAS